MTTEDIIKIMQGALAGEEIEFRVIGGCEDLWIVTHAPQWDWMHYDYRLAPAPKTIWVNEYTDGSGGYGFTDKATAERNASSIHGRQLVEYREVK